MPSGSHGCKMRRTGLRIAARGSDAVRDEPYVVQEDLVVLVAIALVFVPVLFALVAFVLLQDGVRLALRWLNTSLARLTV